MHHASGSWCLLRNCCKTQHGYTALMSAVDGGATAGGHPDCVGLLLAAGANLEAKDEVRIIQCRPRIHVCAIQ